MFDHNNLVCRLFAVYMLEATTDSYISEGCHYIVNRFYDHVELFKDDCDAYTRAQWKVPVYADWFKNMERHYELAETNRMGETGDLLFRAEMKAANTPVTYPIYVRPVSGENGSITYKFFKKLARGKYELIPQYANVIGFKSKAKAEKRARELEVLA